MAAFTALYDACILYSAPLTDLLMQLALEDLFRARWTERIHEEWISSLCRNRPDLDIEQLQRRRRLMDLHVRDSLVTGYEPLMAGLSLPDPEDRHVLAAAIRARADVIVSFNLQDFPNEALHPFGIEAQHPDEFLVHLIGLFPGKFCAAARRQRSSLRHPPRSASEYLDILARNGLPRTAALLGEFSAVI